MLASLFLAISLQDSALDHAHLLTNGSTNAAMLGSTEEAWAVARLSNIGPTRERELVVPDRSGAALVFDLDLQVLDGWNVPKGPLRAFWSEGGTETRHSTVVAMVGQTVLVRFAPVREGRFQFVSGSDEKPDLLPTFHARANERYVSILLPYEGTKLEAGSPAQKRWATLWRAGASLSASAYPDFASYISAAELPVTPKGTGKARFDTKGEFLDNDVVGLADVEWLLRLAASRNPEFQMMVAEYLRRRDVVGATAMQRDLVLLALQKPEAFPNGLFAVADSQCLDEGVPSEGLPWLSGEKTIAALGKAKSPVLIADLLTLLGRYTSLSPERTRLLPLLSSPDPRIRISAQAVFDKWHGKAPKGTDSLAWHRSRAKLSRAELQSAKASSGG